MIKVAHIVRKKSQLDSSFIYNQILNHQKASVVIFFAYDDHQEGVANFPLENFTHFNLNWVESFIDTLRIKFFFNTSRSKAQAFKKLLLDVDPDIIHFHYGSDAALFLPIIKEFNIPSLVSFYGYDCTGFPRYYFGAGLRYLQKKVFPYANCITAMSTDMKRDIIRLGGPAKNIWVHYHGINTELFDKSNASIVSKAVPVRLLIVSSFTPQKGHLFLLKGFDMAYKKQNNVYLTIVGHGRESKDIIKYTEEQQIQNVVIKEPVRYASKEHIDYLSSTDIFIHPSITDPRGNKEGIPGAIVEAMTIGLPVITTYHAGIPDVIKHMKTGYLVPENDVKALSDAIIKLSTNEHLRKTLGRNAKQFALANLDILTKEKELEDIYLQLITDKCAESAE